MAQSDWTRLGGISRDTYVATGANVESYVASQIGAAYKAKGSIAFANLPAPGSGYQGFVYNVTDAFTTTSSFVEGSGRSYPAGTNVVCVNTTGSTWAWDVLTGMVDLSGKQDKITASGILKGDGAGGVTAASSGTDYVAPEALGGYVPTSRKVAGKALSSDIALSGSDIAETYGAATNVHDAFVAVKQETNAAASAASSAGTKAANNAAARKTTLKAAIDTMYSPTTYPDKQSLYAALDDMDDLADTLADLIIALRAFCSAD